MNYEKDLRIDVDALDTEWADQPALALKYCRHYAECVKELQEAEEEIKITRSELIKEANENPVGCCDKEKPNAGDIEAYYRNHDRHKKAKEQMIVLQYEVNMAESAKNEFSFSRKAALENLVILHGQQYFAGPKVPRDLSKEYQKKHDQKKAHEKVKIVRRSK